MVPGRGAGLLAPPPAGPPGGTTVLLLAGDGALIARSIDNWSSQRPAAERWALIRATDDVPSMPPPSGLDVVDFAGGCACCVAASAFSLTIARLLRRGAVDRLFITLAATADPARVADALWSGPLADRLAAVEIVAVMASAAPAWRADLLTGAGLGAADVLLLDSPAVHDGPHRLRELLVGADAGADPHVLAAPPAGLGWAELRSFLDAVRAPSRWRWLADGAAGQAGGLCHRWIWPAATVFDRRRIEAALREGAYQPHVAELRAVIRTSREWYAWAADVSGARWTPTASRRESRIECRIGPDARFDGEALGRAWQAALAHDAPRTVRD